MSNGYDIESAGTIKGSVGYRAGNNGLSAYQLALIKGYKGTLEEWLQSLKGDKGDSPYIKDGYWHIGETNTGVAAQNLPAVTAEDEGKFLRVEDGKWAAVEIPYAEGEEY